MESAEATRMVSLAKKSDLGEYWCYKEVEHISRISLASRVQIHGALFVVSNIGSFLGGGGGKI